MKKYTSRATKWLAMLTVISVVISVIGIAFLHQLGSQILWAIFGGFISILFLACFLAEKSRVFIIDDDKIIIPRGAIKNEKLSFQRTVINIDEIGSVESKLHKGDGLISKDTYFHILTLKDDIKITFTLYAYGKEEEKEILEIINKKLHL